MFCPYGLYYHVLLLWKSFRMKPYIIKSCPYGFPERQHNCNENDSQEYFVWKSNQNKTITCALWSKQSRVHKDIWKQTIQSPTKLDQPVRMHAPWCGGITRFHAPWCGYDGISGGITGSHAGYYFWNFIPFITHDNSWRSQWNLSALSSNNRRWNL